MFRQAAEDPDASLLGTSAGETRQQGPWSPDAPRPDAGRAQLLASQIISMVAMRVAGAKADADPRTDCLDMLLAAAGSADSAARRAYLCRMQEYGATPQDIVDLYIPEAARRLGVEWEQDIRGFSDVTIGAARLQAMVRELDRSWQAEQAANSRAPSILMVVQEYDDHTLGTMVAACKFRRLGVSVHMMLGKPDREVVAALRGARFDMVTVALSYSQRADAVRRLVRLLKSQEKAGPPVVAGGPAMLSAVEIQKFTGVDHVTSDCAEALHLCGLSVPNSSASRQKVQV